jgi:hypothetical protein
VGKEAEVVVEAQEHHPLDQVAKELSNPTVSRRRALKLMVGALVGGAGLALIPGVAAAAPPQHANAGGKYGSSAPPEHAQDKTGFGAGGRFGPGGAPRNYCGGTYICSRNSDCAGGCTCSCQQNIKNIPTSICC